jgi:hypothetical protein
MLGGGSREPVVVDEQFVLGEAASVLSHTKVRQSVRLAFDDGCHCRGSYYRLRAEVALARLAWCYVIHFAIDDLLRDSRTLLLQSMVSPHAKDLTNHSSQPLDVVKSRFNFMKQFSMFATLAPASGGSAPSRYAHASLSYGNTQ